jgi:hypothetical protein
MPSRDYPAVHGPPLANAGIVDRLDQFASLLDLAEPYTARAYRRAAECEVSPELAGEPRGQVLH